MLSEEAVVGAVDAPDVHLMTLNVRRRMPRLWPGTSADRWATRRPRLGQLLRRERPGILGLQEVLPDQSAEIRDLLGPGYTFAGAGRGRGGTGERCEIAVDSARFSLEEADTWWLSSTPAIPGSRSFGNVIPRIVTQALIVDRVTGSRIQAFVTHLDHLSARSRLLSAGMLARAADRVEGPVVVMGDFNADAGRPPHRALVTSGRLVDAFETAGSRLGPVSGTYSHYGPPKVDGRRLDWILVDSGASIECAGVNTARPDGGAVSDHDPVQAVVRWDAS